MRPFSIAKAGALTIIVSALFPALCSSLNLPDLEKSLRTQKIISPSMRVSSALQSGTLTFSIFPEKETKETTGTLKIRAVLIAKTVMSTDKNVQKVEVRFHEKEKTDLYTQILVRSVDIKAFSAGVTSEEELLNGLQLSTASGGSTSEPVKSSEVNEQSSSEKKAEPEIAAGAKRDERAKLAARVHALKSKGVGVKPFLLQLEAVDELAKAGESIALSEKLEQLDYSIAEQEKILSERTAKANAAVAAAASPPKITKTPAARTAAPRASASGAPSSRYSNLANTLASSSETAPLLRLFEGYAQHMKQKYNIDERLIPEQGPYWHERYNLAIMIRLYREKGYGDAIMPTWMECQQLAKAGEQAQTAYKMQTIAQALKLPDPIKNAGWYETQAEAYKRQFHNRHEEEKHRSER